MFYQADLFEQSRCQAHSQPRSPARPTRITAPLTSLAELVDRISAISRRPRYALLVLDLIARQAGTDGRVGPHVPTDQGRVAVRDWLCSALSPLAKRDCRRLALIEAVRSEVTSKAGEAADPHDLEREIDAQLQARITRSGRTSVSRAVSDLVKAGLLRRHYQGYRVDHPNRGAQREAVYTITEEARRILSREGR
ncbi:hypothetical protein YP76_13460 [Sphingobium chungbukense]|uniref:Uncharacterized protein n=1 Tax=Sphingobium chungbukense TaxID=56193 RepID=A0A0M3ANA8_9SPHN|nr:hypothetical protein YP76_13460 [Sphingobium chungbukense]